MNFKRYRDWLIVVLSLAIPFWFLRASMKDPKQATGADRVLVQIASPIQAATATLARGISHLWSDYVYLVDVKANNASLMSDNARLRERTRELEGLEAENRRLKRLLDLKNSVQEDVVTAQVIGKKTNEFFRMMRVTLDRSSPAIGPDQGVLSPDGVVGVTTKIAGDTIDVKLLTDPSFNLDVVVERTQSRGVLKGTNDTRAYSCLVEYVSRTDEVDIGDVLVTGGNGVHFAKGIPVCTVNKVTKRDFGINQQVGCVPTVDFSRLEEVVIVLGHKRVIPPEATAPTGR